MENEIKVGDWIRDREGHITKIIETLSLFKDVELYLGEDGYQYSDNAIVKHSSNLIDLIQCGDYVNGKEVKHIADFEGIEQPIRKVIFVNKAHLIPGETAENKDIETVVTKEQFKSISYKVTKM